MVSRGNYPATAEARSRVQCSAPIFQLGAMYRAVTGQSLQCTRRMNVIELTVNSLIIR
jgi:hypothetical protein